MVEAIGKWLVVKDMVKDGDMELKDKEFVVLNHKNSNSAPI